MVLPSNSDVPEEEMQLLCDAVATMAGFWTPAETGEEPAKELVFQVGPTYNFFLCFTLEGYGSRFLHSSTYLF